MAVVCVFFGRERRVGVDESAMREVVERKKSALQIHDWHGH